MIFINNIINVLSPSRYDNKTILVVVIFLIAVLLTDISLIKVYDLIKKSNEWDIPVFVLISSVYSIGQYLILQFVKYNSIKQDRIRLDLHLNILQKVITLAQYVLSTILVF